MLRASLDRTKPITLSFTAVSRSVSLMVCKEIRKTGEEGGKGGESDVSFSHSFMVERWQEGLPTHSTQHTAHRTQHTSHSTQHIKHRTPHTVMSESLSFSSHLTDDRGHTSH